MIERPFLFAAAILFFAAGAALAEPSASDRAAVPPAKVGASAPEVLVQELVARLKKLGAQSVRPLDGIQETVSFTLPRELKA